MHGYHGPLSKIRPGGRGEVTGSHVVWTVPKFHSNVPSPVVAGGLVFAIEEEGGILQAVDAESGRDFTRQRLDPAPGRTYASPLAAESPNGPRLYIVSRENGTLVVSADREMRVLAHNTLDDDGSIFNGSPVPLGDEALLLRSDRRLYCIRAE